MYIHKNVIFLRFIYVNIGSNGKNSDGKIWQDFPFNQEEGTLQVPLPKLLHHSNYSILFHLVSDEAFSLKQYLMKPYSMSSQSLTHDKLVFNYRLSRARCIIG